MVGIDDAVECRWGAPISARDIDRDPVRSGYGHCAKASSLSWLCVMPLAPVPWAGSHVWALPFLTALAPSECWLPGRRVVAVADCRFSAIELLRDAGRHLCLTSQLRLDAALYAPTPRRGACRARLAAPRLGATGRQT